MRFHSHISSILIAKIEPMLWVLGKCTRCRSILIDCPQWGSQTKRTEWALPVRRFYLSKSWMWVRPICILLAGTPIQTPLGKTQRFGWQCCNVAKGPGLGIGKPGFLVVTHCVSQKPIICQISENPSGNQLKKNLTGILTSQKFLVCTLTLSLGVQE